MKQSKCRRNRWAGQFQCLGTRFTPARLRWRKESSPSIRRNSSLKRWRNSFSKMKSSAQFRTGLKAMRKIFSSPSRVTFKWIYDVWYCSYSSQSSPRGQVSPVASGVGRGGFILMLRHQIAGLLILVVYTDYIILGFTSFKYIEYIEQV